MEAVGVCVLAASVPWLVFKAYRYWGSAAKVRAASLERQPLTDAERRTYKAVLEQFTPGEPFTWNGRTIRRAQLARGLILVQAHHVEVLNAEEYRRSWVSKLTRERFIHWHGWHSGGLFHRVERCPSRSLLNLYGGETGEHVLVVYERGGRQHLVFSRSGSNQPVRSAMRAGHVPSKADGD